MDWWYKSKKHTVTADTIFSLQETVKDVLREGKSLARVSLYHDDKFFYIKTTNKISLNHFLFQNHFEEMEEDPGADLNLLFGTQ